MITPDLLDYIKQQLEQGFSKEQIKNILLNNGWQEKDIDEAFYSILNPQPSSGMPQAPIPQPQTIQTNFSLLSATGLLKKSLDIYKQNFGLFIGIMIIPVMILTVISFFSEKIFNPSFILPKLSNGENLWQLIFLFLGALTFSFFLMLWNQIALVYAVKDKDEKIGIFEAYRKALNKIFSYLWISLLGGLIIFGGLIFLIIPGIIFAIWFSFGVFILISENLKGIDALLKSKEYVKGKLFNVFWRFLFINLIYLAFFFILSLIFGLLNISPKLDFVKYNIAMLLFNPLWTIYGFLFYENLKTIKGEMLSSFKNSQRAIFIFFGGIGILIAGMILFYGVKFIKSLNFNNALKDLQNKMNQNQINQTIPQNLFMSSTTMPSTFTNELVSDPDIEKVKTILEDIKQGFITGDNSFIIKHSSKETVDFLNLVKNVEQLKEFNVKNIFKDGEKIIADVVIVYLNGRPEQSYFVFVKQGDDWKFSLKDSFEYTMNKEIQNSNINSNPNGLPDLVVTSIDIYPTKPIVNDKNLEIVVRIKNIGDKTSEKGAPLEASLLGFKGSIPIAGGDLFPLAPGKETTWQFRPYSNNDFFKIKDTPGTKTIQIILNPGNKIKESNYDNNIFNQKIEVYSN